VLVRLPLASPGIPRISATDGPGGGPSPTASTGAIVRTTDTMPHPRLAVIVAVSEVAGDSAAVVVSAVGEIDQVTAPALQDQLSRVIASKPRRLVIDLSRVSFLSAAGLSVLISVRQAAARQDIALQLRAPNRRMVVRMLDITGLDRLFEIVPPITDREKTPGSARRWRKRPRQRKKFDSATVGGGDRPRRVCASGAPTVPLRRAGTQSS
jgi:anti-anti-sigma factor